VQKGRWVFVRKLNMWDYPVASRWKSLVS